MYVASHYVQLGVVPVRSVRNRTFLQKMCKTPMQGSSKQDLNTVEEYDSDSCDSLLTVNTEEMNVVDKDQYPNKIFVKMLLNGAEQKFQTVEQLLMFYQSKIILDVLRIRS